MRKCIITNEMRPKKDMIRVVINKEGDIFADGTGKQQEKGVLERYFNADSEKLDPVYKEIIRLIYREEIPK